MMGCILGRNRHTEHFNPLYVPDLRPVTVQKEEITIVTITPVRITQKIIIPPPLPLRRWGSPPLPP
jgi:hypothetical protein